MSIDENVARLRAIKEQQEALDKGYAARIPQAIATYRSVFEDFASALIRNKARPTHIIAVSRRIGGFRVAFRGDCWVFNGLLILEDGTFIRHPGAATDLFRSSASDSYARTADEKRRTAGLRRAQRRAGIVDLGQNALYVHWNSDLRKVDWLRDLQPSTNNTQDKSDVAVVGLGMELAIKDGRVCTVDNYDGRSYSWIESPMSQYIAERART